MYNIIYVYIIYVYIIFRVRLPCFAKHRHPCALDNKSLIRNPNDRSKPFILFSISICAWRPNFTFFGIFLLFIKPL